MSTCKNVGIFGYGFVGQALHASLKPHNVNDIDVTIFDPIKTKKRFHGIICDTLDIVFICVPTPENDLSYIDSVIDELAFNRYDGIVVIKSTITHKSLVSLLEEKRIKYMHKHNHDLKIVVNPEFLNQNTYIEDGQNQKYIVLGGDYQYTKQVEELYNLTKLQFKSPKYEHCTIEDAINFKFTRNLYGAYKVLFWEFIQDRTGNARKMAQMLENIPQGEMSQVGMDGFRGFGGACFPKDLANFHNEEVHILTEFMIDYNESLHGE